jgi:TonB family protein
VVISGLTLSSTSANGSFSVPVGNTLMAPVARTATEPSQVKPYKAERYAPRHELTEMPVYLDNVSIDVINREYPEAARRAEVEGEVKALITVDADGSVVAVRVREHPGYGFDNAATKILKMFRFRPGRVGGQAVATEITYTLRFELPY